MAEPPRVQSRAKTRPGTTLVVDPHAVRRAGQLLAERLREVLANRVRVRLAIPGGSALAAAAIARALLGEPWRRVALTWVDERCVPVADVQSNRGAAARLGMVSAAAWKAGEPCPGYVLPLFEDGEAPEQALLRVEAGLAQEFDDALDVVLLGMGADGHVASLFPSRSVPTAGRVAHVADSPKPPRDRITLTPLTLATARFVILVATGEAKRTAVERLVSGDAALPAHALSGLTVVTDLELDSVLEGNEEGTHNVG